MQEFDSRPECEKYRETLADPNDPGRPFEMCNGRSYTDRPPAALQFVNYWRLARNLEPLPLTHDTGQRRFVQRTPTPLIDGVGDCFAKITHALGIDPKEDKGCECVLLQTRMNLMGILGCRHEFDKLADELREKTKHYTLIEKFRAATKAVTTGLVVRGVINPLDPISGLLRIAIKQAEYNKSKAGTQQAAQ